MQYRGAKIITSATIIVWTILLLKDTQQFESADTYRNAAAPPSLDAFQNYEEMQKYITEKESRRLKKVANPLDDSYIDAYNFHHESPERVIVKRDTEAKEGPQIFKFELEDAKEPDEQTKELIRVHRARQMDLENAKDSNRTKRSAKFTEPKLIRFEVSDAKEPDEATKELIRQSRARELKQPTERAAIRTTRSPQKTSRKVAARKSKRTRRWAQKTQPQFIQFELSDAKDPSFKVREMIQQITGSGNSSEKMDPGTNDTEDDSFMEESNRFFYQSLPLKSKRLVNAVPIKVQKIIDMMVKDKQVQANHKHTANKQHASVKPLGNVGAPVAENLITVYPTQVYGQKIIPVPVYKYPVNVLAPPPYKEPAATAPAEIPQVNGNLQHYQYVPLSQLAHPIYQQQIKYIAPSQASAPAAEIPQVSAKQHRYHLVPLSQLDPSVYQQPSKNVEIIPAITQTLHEIQAAQQFVPPTSLNQITHNQIPPRYPYAKIVYLDPSYRNGKHLLVHSNQQRPEEPQQTNEQRLNLEHQQQLESNKVIQDQEQRQQHIQDIQEFKELSKLVDKSPTDQMHGLTYLLAKEMQRRKRLYSHRPQDNTSPILFHQNDNGIAFGNAVNHPIQPEPEKIPIAQPVLPTAIPEPIEDLPPKSYNSIVDNGPHVNYVSQPSAASQEYPTNDASALGLSPNYQGIDNFKDSNPAQSHVSESSHEAQYAPKYAFGYRVRDFHSGNDFGHRQHRDTDGVTRGQYHILLPDGRVQNVIYHADDTGFHADVNFETGHP